MATVEEILERIARFTRRHGGGVAAAYRQGGYTLYHEASGQPIARLPPVPDADQFNVLCWSHRGRWVPIGNFGGVVMPLDEALLYIASEGIFWMEI